MQKDIITNIYYNITNKEVAEIINNLRATGVDIGDFLDYLLLTSSINNYIQFKAREVIETKNHLLEA